MRASVDLPDPDSPTTPNERPWPIEKLTPSSAGRTFLRANGPTPGETVGLDQRLNLEQRRLAHR